MAVVLVEAAGVADEVALDGALVVQLGSIDLVTTVGAVGDIDFLVLVERADPDAMTGVERVVAGAFSADGFEGFQLLSKRLTRWLPEPSTT